MSARLALRTAILRARDLPAWLWQWREPLALATLVVLALVERVVWLDRLEPNVMPDEADNLQLIYRMLAGRGPGPFGVSWDGNPAFSLYPALLSASLFGPSYVSLRLSTVAASLVAIVAFYGLCRQRCSPLASLCATALLASSVWFLCFSRNGEVNVYITLYTVAAAWSLERALATRRLRWYGLVGFWAAMGWYGYLAGLAILPVMLLALALAWLFRPDQRAVLVRGSALMLLVWVVVVLPRVPTMVEWRAAIEGHTRSRSVLHNTPPAQWSEVLQRQLSRTLRAFLVFDPSLQGNRRYIPPGSALLDSTTATLYVVGLVLAARRFRQLSLWWCLWAAPLVGSQIMAVGVPDAGRGIGLLPAMMLFVGLAIDWLIHLRGLGVLATAGVLVLVPATAWSNWQHYQQWMGRPEAAAARQPAVELDEFPEWQARQMEEALAGRGGFNVYQWHAMRSQILPAARPVGPTPSIATVPSPSATTELRVRPAFVVGGPSLSKPRGLDAGPDGAIYLVDAGLPQVLRLGAGEQTLAPLPGDERLEDASDIAVSPDGTIYVAEAGLDRILVLKPDGATARVLGADWSLYRPRGLAIGPDGTLYVADTGQSRIVIAAPEGGQRRSIGPDVRGGRLVQPTDVAVDDAGRLYVAEPEAGRVQVLDADGDVLARWDIPKGGTVDGPHLALAPTGLILVTEGAERRVSVYDGTGRLVGRIPVEEPGAMPYGVTFSGSRIFISDPRSRTVRAFEVELR